MKSCLLLMLQAVRQNAVIPPESLALWMPLGPAVQKVAFQGGRHRMVLRMILAILFLVQMEDLVPSQLAATKQS